MVCNATPQVSSSQAQSQNKTGTSRLKTSTGMVYIFVEIAWSLQCYRFYSRSVQRDRCNGLLVSAHDSGLSDPSSSPDRGHYLVFLHKTLYSHSASLHPGVQMGGGKFDPGDNPAMDQHPILGEIEIFLVASCFRNRKSFLYGLHFLVII